MLKSSLLLLLALLSTTPVLTSHWEGTTLVLTVVSTAPVVFVCPAGDDGRCSWGGTRIDGGSGVVRVASWARRPRYVAEAYDGITFLGASVINDAPFVAWLPIMQ